MSLATRITLLVSAVLAACGLAAGAALHRAAARVLEAQLHGRLDARLDWLGWALDVEPDDGELHLDARDDPPAAAEHWQVATADGRVLWSSAGQAPPGPQSVTRSRAASFGPAGAPALPGAALVEADEA